MTKTPPRKNGAASQTIDIIVNGDTTIESNETVALKTAGAPIFDDGVPPTDFEPEYLAISPDGIASFSSDLQIWTDLLLGIDYTVASSVVTGDETAFTPTPCPAQARRLPGLPSPTR